MPKCRTLEILLIFNSAVLELRVSSQNLLRCFREGMALVWEGVNSQLCDT